MTPIISTKQTLPAMRPHDAEERREWIKFLMRLSGVTFRSITMPPEIILSSFTKGVTGSGTA